MDIQNKYQNHGVNQDIINDNKQDDMQSCLQPFFNVHIKK